MDCFVRLLCRLDVRVSVDMSDYSDYLRDREYANDSDLDPPETCKNCGEYHALAGGLCWSCLEEMKAIAAEEKADEMRERKLFGEMK